MLIKLLNQILEFVGNHLFFTGSFLFFAIAFFINESRLGGAKVSPSELVGLVNRNDASVLDLRDLKDYNLGHIAGSKSFPASSFDARVGELEGLKKKTLVLVCKMGQHSGPLGKKLKALGFEDIRRLAGGMAEWTASNLPLVKK
ncbi:MAG: rhodanese-like domain-containing protein [Pseudomonadota bacterium]|nr:rhodanese-like domain-containing protein [Pseudomonadota bacterium]